MVSPIQWPPSRPPKHLIFQFLPHLSAAAPHLARPGKSMPQLCVAAPTTHPVRLLVLVSQNQPAASIFLSKNPAPASPNQHLHRPTIKLTISALHRLPPALSSSATCPPFLTAPCPFSRSIYRHLSSSFISSRHRPPAHRRPLSLSLSFSLALSLSTLAATFFAVLSSSFGLSSLPSPRTRSRRSMSPPRRSCDASHSN